jgi:hypothetical protein
VPLRVILVAKMSVNIPVIAVRIFVIFKLDQMVEVPVVDALPTTILPRSFTRKVDEPARFLTASELEVVDVPLPLKINLLFVVVAMSVMNAKFSTQLDPFQYIALPVAEPLASAPAIEIHFVDVPLEDNTCPGVPVAPYTSRNA